MVCYQTQAGTEEAKRDARVKHFVLFDAPGDLGAKLKSKHPKLGWVPDLEGHPTLPFSIAARLILQVVAERDDRATGLLTGFLGIS